MDGKIVCILGPQNTNKSRLISHAIEAQKRHAYDQDGKAETEVFVFCTAENTDTIQWYKNVTDRANIYHDTDALQNVMHHCIVKRQDGKNEQGAQTGSRKDTTHSLIILEDEFCQQGKLFGLHQLRHMFINGKYLKATVMWITRSLAGFPPFVIRNTHYFMCSGVPAHCDMQRIFQITPRTSTVTFQEFQQLLRYHTTTTNTAAPTTPTQNKSSKKEEDKETQSDDDHDHQSTACICQNASSFEDGPETGKAIRWYQLTRLVPTIPLLGPCAPIHLLQQQQEQQEHKQELEQKKAEPRNAASKKKMTIASEARLLLRQLEAKLEQLANCTEEDWEHL